MSTRAPRGYKFVVTPKKGLKKKISIDLVESKSNKTVGGVDLEWINPRYLKFDPWSANPLYKRFETHSELEENLREKGYGILIYAKAIAVGHSRGLRIGSSRHSTIEAVRVWKSKRLRKMFEIRKRGERYIVLRTKIKNVISRR